ncbi:hypothetical protein C6990_07635 [Nitrosopumilus sp. b3]|uniref:hypothetical protein n=1 Tax=Nitrosopumilus sp. b3 TaxID=2109909 RepID=UPI0015F5778D|nr:hypothetical protein [Nitrosopumilus sp. b3]KAF6246947.1 hypothetical protein C6990_07635 [Nitrosopumilus sp. b3]
MNNDETKYHMIIRATNSDNLPDVENYIRTLHEKGFFAQLIKEGKFTVEEVKKLPFGKLCDIFFREEGQKIKNGDIRIFKDTGDYTINVHTG